MGQYFYKMSGESNIVNPIIKEEQLIDEEQPDTVLNVNDQDSNITNLIIKEDQLNDEEQHDTVLNVNNIQTFNECVIKYGNDYKMVDGSSAFFARSYDEDCFLVSNRNKLMQYQDFKRIEWNNYGKYIVLYMVGDKSIKIFN